MSKNIKIILFLMLVGFFPVTLLSQIPNSDLQFIPAFDTDEETFDNPLWVGENPAVPGFFLVLEQHSGMIYALENEGGSWTRQIFKDVGNVGGANEAGLLSLAFHPDFITNGKYYYYVNPNNSTTEIREGVFSEDRREDSGEEHRVILSVPQPQSNHNGGTVKFSTDPADPYLYISLGDGGKQGDPDGNAQNTDVLLGKILRIDIDNPSDGKEYGIPADNPFASDGGRPEIYAYGLRNPWKFSFDRLPPYQMWVGDVGQNEREEIDLVELGDNLGWNTREGTTCYLENSCDTDGLKEPVTDIIRQKGQSITGGYIYRGNPDSDYYGVYFFADYISRIMWVLTEENGIKSEMVEVGSSNGGIAAYAEDLAGNIYAITRDNGRISRLDLGELAVVNTKPVVEYPTNIDVFQQLSLKQNAPGKVNVYLNAAGNHRVELFKLTGQLVAHGYREGKGTLNLVNTRPLQGIYLLQWTRDEHVFVKRIYLD